MFILRYGCMVKSGKEQAFLDKMMRELMGEEYDKYCVTFIGYLEYIDRSFGEITYPSRHQCAVSLNARYPWDKCNLFRSAVLWHEACHAKLFLEDGRCNGHDKEFQNLRKTKPLYWIADGVMKFIWFWK